MHLLEGAAAVLRGFFLLCDGLIVGSAALGRASISLCFRISRLWRLVRQATSRALPVGLPWRPQERRFLCTCGPGWRRGSVGYF